MNAMTEFSPAADLRAKEVQRMRLETGITALCRHFDGFRAQQAFNVLIAAQAIATIGVNNLTPFGPTETLCLVTDALLHGRPDGCTVQQATDEVRMEFGRRRRTQLLEQGWIV